MEEFVRQIEAYANAFGKQPGTIVQAAKCGGGGTWSKWKLGESTPTLAIVDRVREYMAANPPAASQEENAA